MPYNTGININSESLALERELLLRGLNYSEIAEATNGRIKTISERNRLIHKVNIWDAFQSRIERDGIPNRLAVSDSFGYWFSGFFDGEGCIFLFHRARGERYAEYRFTIRVHIRDDDADAVAFIYDNLKVGRIARHGSNGSANPSISWSCEKINDLAEIIIPLFERYPLHTKKAKEFSIWKPLVLQRYINTMGGYSNRKSIPEEQHIAFLDGVEAVNKIRTYTR